MMLKLQRYDLSLVYKPGKELVIADTLSRAYLPDENTDHHIENELKVCMVLSASPTKLQHISTETANDPDTN